MGRVNKTVIALPVLALASVVSTSALAQQSGQQIVVIEGVLYESNIPALLEYQPPLEFRAEIGENLDTAVPMSDEGGSYAVFSDATFSISMQVFGPEGEIVFEQTLANPTPNDFSNFGQIALFSFAMEGGEQESGSESAFWGLASLSETSEVHEVRLGGLGFLEGPEGPVGEQQQTSIIPLAPAPLFADISNYPVLVTGETSQPFEFTSLVSGGETGPIGVLNHNDGNTPHQEGYMAGMATNISYGDLDSDGDGVADAVDKCSPSVLTETVEFGWIDTGVVNAVGDDGCSLMDRYAKCEADAEEVSSPFSWFRPVYSGPSYCEKQVAYQAVTEGLIGYSEARVLRGELYNFYRSGGDRR